MDILSGSADEFRQIRVFTHRYARPNDIRALAAYLATFAAYAFGFIAVFWGLGAGLWGVAVLGWGLTAFAIVRLYVIQHDCGHASVGRAHFLARRLRPYGLWKNQTIALFKSARCASLRP